jgi:N,N'-diacetylchitobiose transport system substrate-binding protein
MRARYVGALALVGLFVAAVTAGAGTARVDASTATSITVWLQQDAQQAWPGVVDAANAAFKAQHPDVEVKIEYQTWTEHLTKLDAAIAGNNAPDVVEMGNTEMTKYMAAGAFADITSARSQFANSATWLKSLRDSATYRGKLYGVPYYAGARAVIYRKDYYRRAGFKSPPRSLSEFISYGSKLMQTFKKDKKFSALYFAGQYWYAGMSFVYDYGGTIAAFRNGQWVGTLNEPKALQGLNKLKQTVLATSRASKTTDEAHPWQFTIFPQGHVASMIANGWEWGLILDPKDGNPKLANVLGAYPMPSHVKGKYMPTFLGGSDLAVTAASKNRALAIDWIKAFTSTNAQRQLATVGKVIPNTTSLASVHAGNPQLAPFAEAAKASWFVPTAPGWANVESARVLQNMMTAIFTGRKTVQKAATDASKQITQILNS